MEGTVANSFVSDFQSVQTQIQPTPADGLDFYFYSGALVAAILGFVARHYGWTNLLMMYNGFIWGWGYIRKIRGVLPETGDEKQPLPESIAEDGGIQAVNEKAALLAAPESTEDIVYEDPVPAPRLHRRAFYEPGLYPRQNLNIETIPAILEHLALNAPRDAQTKIFINGQEYPCFRGTDQYVVLQVLISGSGNLDFEARVFDGHDINEYHLSPSVQAGVRTRKSADNKTVFWSLEDRVWKQHGYWILQLNKNKRVIILLDEKDEDPQGDERNGVFNVTDIDTNGGSHVTSKVQEALDKASAWGRRNRSQGTVVLPPGKLVCGNLNLDSNTRLHFLPGACLWSTEMRADYRIDWSKNSTGKDMTFWVSTKPNTRNISITGRGGLLNGRGKEQRDKSDGTDIAMNMVVPYLTSNFQYDGPIVRDGSSWTVMPIRSNKLRFKNLKILNRHTMAENDGFDACESQDCSVSRSIAICLDDCYSTKTWSKTTDVALKWQGDPQRLDLVTFDNCVAWTRCFGYKVGGGVGTRQTRVTFSNCTTYESAIAFGVMATYGDAEVSDVHFYNMVVENSKLSLEGRSTWFRGEIRNGDNRGVNHVSKVLIENITVLQDGVGNTSIDVRGAGENAKFRGLDFRGIHLPQGTAENLAMLNIVHKDADLTLES